MAATYISDSCGGWNTFTSVFGAIWDGIAGAAGASEMQGLVPQNGCYGWVYTREHVNDQRVGYGIITVIITATVLTLAAFLAVKLYHNLKRG